MRSDYHLGRRSSASLLQDRCRENENHTISLPRQIFISCFSGNMHWQCMIDLELHYHAPRPGSSGAALQRKQVLTFPVDYYPRS